MRKLIRWVAVAAVVAAAVILLWLVLRVVLYRQVDDPRHAATKQTYLQNVETLAGGGSSGPNVVLVLFDDLGYGDLGAYGSRAIRTPHIDRLAAEGALFRHAYSASPYCSASRAGLLTGRYPLRSGLDHVVQAPWTWRDVLLRVGGLNRRLPAEEVTLSEVLSAAGYATAIYGKWHLGDSSPSLPTDRGFDSFYGLLFSNDQGRPQVREGRTVVERHPIDQSTLTRRYTEHAVSFIDAHHDERFFLYVPHTFPHVPLHVASEVQGRSPAGLYGDVVEELDRSVGEIVAALERHGLERDTLVIVTSDNGPWYQGSSGGTRGRKFDIFEGGMRVPFITWWPGRIPPAKVIDDPVMGIDVFPTVLALAGLPPPSDRVIDGGSLVPLLEGTGPGPHDALFFHQLIQPRAIRNGRFKYHDRHGLPYGNPMDWSVAVATRHGPWLFDLTVDPDESYDVSDRYPDVARRLGERLASWRDDLAANPRGWR